MGSELDYFRGWVWIESNLLTTAVMRTSYSKCTEMYLQRTWNCKMRLIGHSKRKIMKSIRHWPRVTVMNQNDSSVPSTAHSMLFPKPAQTASSPGFRTTSSHAQLQAHSPGQPSAQSTSQYSLKPSPASSIGQSKLSLQINLAGPTSTCAILQPSPTFSWAQPSCAFTLTQPIQTFNSTQLCAASKPVKISLHTSKTHVSLQLILASSPTCLHSRPAQRSPARLIL
jgi:hypothetical protein